MIDQLTRGEYLLDLCLTNIDGCKARVEKKIADHSGIVLQVPIPAPQVKRIPRIVWHFKDARWKHLQSELRAIDWHFLEDGSVDQAVSDFSSILHGMRRFYIPWGKLEERRSTHPWLDETCIEAINGKKSC